jgi:hypothetical protein
MRWLFLVLIGLTYTSSFAQEGVLQMNDPVHDFLLRQQALGNLDRAFLIHRPLSHYDARGYLKQVDPERLSSADRVLIERYLSERALPGAAWANRTWGVLYRNNRNLLSDYGDGYAFEIDPLLYLTAGQARMTAHEDGPSVTTWQNTRGVRGAGRVGPHIFFESRIEENQRRDAWPAFEQRTAPRLGGSKFYSDSGTYDYWRAMGLVGFRTNFFEVRAGRDRNRWSDGLGSLFLSDFAPHYDQIQIRTTVGRIQYINLFTAWTDLASVERRGDHVFPRKYGALHALAVDLPGRVQLHFYEAVIMAPDYDDGRRQGFDLSYLNPIIFYRAVEIDRGSPDNMQIGGGISWIPIPGLRVYTQGLLTEFKLSELTAGDGWFGNKWGWLAGMHIVPQQVTGLDVHLEHARVRPFTYSHRDVETTFVSYNDPLGHPAEQNFFDYTLRIRYQPVERVTGSISAFYTLRGRDTATENYGGDPRASYTTRLSNHGHYIGQGIRSSEWRIEAVVGYEVLPSMYLDIALRSEDVDDALRGRNRYVNPLIQLRWGLPFQSMRY